jgi:predicted TPR repeat methyltransferase
VDVDWERISRLEQSANDLLREGRREAARDVLLEALALEPDQPKLLVKLAPLELKLGNAGAALDAMRRYVALEPQDTAAREGLVRLRERLTLPTDEGRGRDGVE